MEAKDLSIFDMVFGGVIKDNVIAPDKENTNPTIAGVLGSWRWTVSAPKSAIFATGNTCWAARCTHCRIRFRLPTSAVMQAAGRFGIFHVRQSKPRPESRD